MSYRTIFAFVTLLSVLTAAGCKSSNPAPETSTAVPARAVIATTGNGTTTIYLPAGTGVQTLSTASTPACADCTAAAARYFQGGALEAKCPVCGATRTAAIGHQ